MIKPVTCPHCRGEGFSEFVRPYYCSSFGNWLPEFIEVPCECDAGVLWVETSPVVVVDEVYLEFDLAA